MKPLQRPRWAMLALAFAVGAGLLWWWRVIVCEGTVRLADGREVGVLALTYGTNHVFVDGKLWVKLARPLLSPAKASQLGLRIYERATDVPSLMVWTHWRLPLTNPAPRFASVVDRHGVESEPGVAAAEVSVPHSTKAVMAWNLASYPRRQGRIVLRFYERDTAYCPHRVGELAVRLSGNGASKTWRAPVPPIRVARDGREFTLVALRGGEPMSAELKWPFTFIAPWTTALFEVRENGQRSDAWTIKSLEAVGATGNHFAIPRPRFEWVNGQLATVFPHVLWADEPDWRFMVEFSRMRDFAAEQLWTFKSLPVCRDRPAFTTNFEAAAAGMVFRSLDLRGTGQITRYARDGYRRTSDLTLLFTPWTNHVRVDLARVQDDRGRAVRFGQGWEPWTGKYTAGLEVPSDATSLDLTFAIHPSEVVEFLTRPELGTSDSGKQNLGALTP